MSGIMNWMGFIDLINEIFNKKVPNINKIQNKGLLAVKIAQTFALRIDFLDELKCTTLAKLFSNVDSVEEERLEELLLEYEEKAWLKNFSSFNNKAFASASIGQVHRGILKSGEDVAVKIIKNNFSSKFEKDVNSLLKLFKVVIFLYPRLSKVADPIGVINSIKKSTLDELNLYNEVKNQKVLKEIHKKNKDLVDISKLKFPKLYEQISSENILVSEFVEGSTLDELLEKKQLSYERLLELFHIHGFYMFGIGTFHGDIHPGNIILKGNDFYFIDTGAIGTVGDKMRRGLFSFMENLCLYEFEKCANSLNEMSEVKITGDNFLKFKQKFLSLYSGFEEKTVQEESLTVKMMETIKLGVKSGMIFEEGMFPVIKSLMYLDGMVLRCNPDANLLKDMRDNIEELKKYL